MLSSSSEWSGKGGCRVHFRGGFREVRTTAATVASWAGRLAQRGRFPQRKTRGCCPPSGPQFTWAYYPRHSGHGVDAALAHLMPASPADTSGADSMTGSRSGMGTSVIRSTGCKPSGSACRCRRVVCCAHSQAHKREVGGGKIFPDGRCGL
jgi:hypothetical protein